MANGKGTVKGAKAPARDKAELQELEKKIQQRHETAKKEAGIMATVENLKMDDLLAAPKPSNKSNGNGGNGSDTAPEYIPDGTTFEVKVVNGKKQLVITVPIGDKPEPEQKGTGGNSINLIKTKGFKYVVLANGKGVRAKVHVYVTLPKNGK